MAINPDDPSILYAGTGSLGSGAFKSIDEGRSWFAVNEGLGTTWISELAIDPSRPSTIYAAGLGVHKSTDGGATWMRMSDGLPEVVDGLVIDPSSTFTLYVGWPPASFSGQGRGVYKSTDGARTWTQVSAGLSGGSARAVVVDPAHPQTVYVGGSDQALYRSTDGGRTWRSSRRGLDRPLTFHELAISSRDPGTIYAAAAGLPGGLFVSTDGGRSWEESLHRIRDSLFGVRVAPSDPDIMYAAGGGGVYSSTNRARTWTKTALHDTLVFSVAVHPGDPLTVYAGVSGFEYKPGALYKSTDGGTRWTRLFSLPEWWSVEDVEIDPEDPSTVYAGIVGAYWGEGRVAKSTDGGRTWRRLGPGLERSGVFDLALDPFEPSTVYAATEPAGVYVSDDGGAHWRLMGEGITTRHVRAVALDPTGSTIYAGTAGGGAFKYRTH